MEIRTRYFNIAEPFEITAEEFAVHWSQVDNIWSLLRVSESEHGNPWKAYSCRLFKRSQSSTRKDGVSDKKRRRTKTRIERQCFAQIKTSFLADHMVRVERHGNSPDHTHSIDLSDIIKRPTSVRTLVVEEASKLYRPPDITLAVQEMIKTNFGENTGVEHLTRKEVANIRAKVQGSMFTHLIGDKDYITDVQDAIGHFKTNQYHVRQFHITQFITSKIVPDKQGFSFATQEQLQKLVKYGWLTLIDSTHNTNKWKWRLFTLYIRDGVGCWDVGGHIFVSTDDSETVAEGLKQIRQMTSNWQPRYILCDNSSIESNAVLTVFPGCHGGEQECEIILCTVHTMRTWMRKIYHAATRSKMILAMHKRTQIGCDEIIEDAIRRCPVVEVTKYIKRYWKNNTKTWALWARQHSPLLLQVTSTNPLESYHSELKSSTSITHGLIGMATMLGFWR